MLIPRIAGNLTREMLSVAFPKIDFPLPISFDGVRDPESRTGQKHVTRIELPAPVFGNSGKTFLRFQKETFGFYTNNPVVFKTWAVLEERGVLNIPNMRFSGDVTPAEAELFGPTFEGRITVKFTDEIDGLAPEATVHKIALLAFEATNLLIEAFKEITFEDIERVVEIGDKAKYTEHFLARDKRGLNLRHPI